MGDHGDPAGLADDGGEFGWCARPLTAHAEVAGHESAGVLGHVAGAGHAELHPAVGDVARGSPRGGIRRASAIDDDLAPRSGGEHVVKDRSPCGRDRSEPGQVVELRFGFSLRGTAQARSNLRRDNAERDRVEVRRPDLPEDPTLAVSGRPGSGSGARRRAGLCAG